MVQDYQLNEIMTPTSPTGELYKRAEVGGAESIYSWDHRRRNSRGRAPSHTHTHSLHITDLEASCQAVTDFVDSLILFYIDISLNTG